MHKYFLIPAIIIFIITVLLVIYSQYFYVDWKWTFIPDNFDTKTETYKEKIFPGICKDESEIKIIKQNSNTSGKRFYKDQADISNDPSVHAVYFLPCDMEDREFDINGNIHSSLQTINEWFLDKTNSRYIAFRPPKSPVLCPCYPISLLY